MYKFEGIEVDTPAHAAIIAVLGDFMAEGRAVTYEEYVVREGSTKLVDTKGRRLRSYLGRIVHCRGQAVL